MTTTEQRELNERLGKWRGWEVSKLCAGPMWYVKTDRKSTHTEFDPCNNVAQAIELLEWWMGQDTGNWAQSTTYNADTYRKRYDVRLFPSASFNLTGTPKNITATADSLSLAICMALDEAIRA